MFITKKVTCNILKKLIYSSIFNKLLLLSFLRYDQLKWEHQMTFIWKKIFNNNFQLKLVLYRNQLIDLNSPYPGLSLYDKSFY